jgi:hypothetical protein
MKSIKATVVCDTHPEGTLGAVISTFDGPDAEDRLRDSMSAWLGMGFLREVHIVVLEETP